MKKLMNIAFIFLFIITGCGGSNNQIIPVIPSITPTPTNQSGAGNISGQALDKNNLPLGQAFIGLYNLTEVTPLKTTVADTSGYYSFSNVPTGFGRIEMWKNIQDYTTNPNNPSGSVNITITENTTNVQVIENQIAPTVTPLVTMTPVTVTPTTTQGVTPSPTPTNTRTITPTPTGTANNPIIHNITYSFVKEGDTITVSGSNLGTEKGQILINNVSSSTIESWTNTEVKCNVPIGAYTGNGYSTFTLKTYDNKEAAYGPFFVYKNEGEKAITSFIPQDLCFNNDGTYFYISSIETNKIYKYGFSDWAKKGESTTLNKPKYIDFCDTNKKLYVSDYIQVCSFDSDIGSQSNFGTTNGSDLQGITWDKVTGKIYVSNTSRPTSSEVIYKIMNYNLDGTGESSFSTGVIKAWDITSDDEGYLYLVSHNSGYTTYDNKIIKYKTDGTKVEEIYRLDPRHITCQTVNSYNIIYCTGSGSEGDTIEVFISQTSQIARQIGIITVAKASLLGIDCYNNNILLSDRERKIHLIKY